MLQFQFEQFVFIPSCCEVKTSGQLIPLDAKTCELLQYFCQNANRVLSRDELLQHVWQNTIVSDNTISKAIATLRKLLTDDAKNPRVIATVPKKGYRFLPQVIESSAEGVNSINLFPDQIKGQTFSNKTKLNKPLAVLFVVLLALLIIVFSPITQNHSSDIKTLTRMAGDKQDLVSSANGERLFFLNVSGKNKELWLHDIQSEKSQRILQKETNIKHLVGLNENTLVALITEKTHQRFVKAKVDNNELSVYRKSQTNLDGWIIRDSIYEPNNDSVYFLARRQNSAKNHLLALGFDDTGAKVIESNELDGLSLRQIDISPDFSKLLLLAVGADDKSTAFSFELESGDIKQLREFDGLIRNVIWHQNGEGLYYNDIPPAQRVLMIRDQNSRKQVITSSS